MATRAIFRIFTYKLNSKIKVMTEQEIYGAEQEFKRFENIMNTQEYLTQEEYDFCLAWDGDIKADTSYIGNYSDLGVYLNLRVYSEHDHEKFSDDECNNDLPF